MALIVVGFLVTALWFSAGRVREGEIDDTAVLVVMDVLLDVRITLDVCFEWKEIAGEKED